MTKIAGSGSINQRHGSPDPDPDPHQNVMDPQHCPQQHHPVTDPVVVEDTAAHFPLHTTQHDPVLKLTVLLYALCPRSKLYRQIG